MATNEKQVGVRDVEVHPIHMVPTEVDGGWLDMNDVLATITITVSPETNPPFSVSSLDVEGYTPNRNNKPLIRTEGGVAGTRYEVDLLLETENGRKINATVYWMVQP